MPDTYLMLRYLCAENLCEELLERGVDGADGVDVADGQVGGRLLRYQRVHPVPIKITVKGIPGYVTLYGYLKGDPMNKWAHG